MKWTHSVLSVLGGIGIAALPVFQTAIATHPAVSGILGVIWAIVGHLLPSPVVQSK